MAKYVINEQSDLNSLAKQVEEIAQRHATTEPAEAVPVHEVAPEETAFKPARTHKAIRQSPLPAILMSAGAALVVVAVVLITIKTQFAGKQRAIPDVVNARVDRALTLLESNGFAANVEYDNASTQPSGTVIAQVPAANTKGRLGTTVTLRVAGKPARTDRQPARNTGIINLGQGESRTGAREKADTTPAKTPPAEKTDQTQVKVNQPAEKPATAKVAVPAVEGQQVEEARKTLRALGVKIVEVAGNDAGKPDGVVLSVEPKVGSEIQAGSPVRIRVNTRPKATEPAETERPAQPEPEMVIVPDYTGSAGQDAVKDLYRRGLRAEWSYQPSNQYTAGTVILTTPPAGSRVPPGTKIILVLSQ